MNENKIVEEQIWQKKADSNHAELPETILIINSNILSQFGIAGVKLVAFIDIGFGKIIPLTDELAAMTEDTILQLYELKQNAPEREENDDEDSNNEEDLESSYDDIESYMKKRFNQFLE